jgi:protein-disulfide isomerase
VVNRVRVASIRRSGVYTIWTAGLLVLAGLVGGACAQSAPPESGADPAMVKGPATAPVTIVEFSDYQCPYCARAQQALAQVLKEYDGRVRIVFKDLPLPSHALARPAHEAARCAGALGRYWAYHDRLFAAQPAFERADLVRYAVELGLPREAFERCVDERRFASAVEADVAQARGLGVRSTPTFLINNRPLVGAHPVENFRSAIDDALQAAR